MAGSEDVAPRAWDGLLTVPPGEFAGCLAGVGGPEALVETLRACFQRGRVLADDHAALEAWLQAPVDEVDRALVLARLIELAVEPGPILSDLLVACRDSLAGFDHPFVAAVVATATARVHALDEAFTEYEVAAVHAGRSLPRDTWLQRRVVEALALHLAYAARLHEIADLVPASQVQGSTELDFGEEVDLFPVIRFIDAVEGGRCREAEGLITALDDSGAIPPGFRELAGAYDSLLILIDLANVGRLEDLPPEVLEEEECQILAACLKGDVRAMHRTIEGSDYAEIATPSSLFGLRSVRLALALSDQEVARVLLDQRLASGLRSPFDDLLRARIARLDGDDEGATRLLARAVEAAVEADAIGRLEFELRLASELSPYDLIRLGGAGVLVHAGERAAQATSDPLALVVAGDRLQVLHAEVERLARAGVPVAVSAGPGGGAEIVAQVLARRWNGSGDPREVVGAAAGCVTDLAPLVAALRDGGLVVRGLEAVPAAVQAQLVAAIDQADALGGPVRMVVTTALPLGSLGGAEAVDPELAVRLAAGGCWLAPLADRRDEIAELAAVRLRQVRQGRPAVVERGLARHLGDHRWPGGVRELHAVLAALVAHHPTRSTYKAEDLAGWWRPVAAVAGE